MAVAVVGKKGGQPENKFQGAQKETEKKTNKGEKGKIRKS